MHWLKKKTEEEGSFVVHTTCEDNMWVEEEYRERLRAYKNIDPYHYKVYYLGEWGTTGTSYFGNPLINARYTYVKYNIKPIIDEKTSSYTYTEIFAPEADKRYVIGVDVAGEGADRNVACVLDEAGNQVAVLTVFQDEILFCDKLEELGYRYNYALIGVEINFSTYIVNELERRKYTNQFIRRRVDKVKKTSTKAFGFRTDKNTRPLMLMQLKKAIQDDPGIVNDIGTLREMQIFIINDTGRPEAEVGGHDDKVIALAIGYYIVKSLESKRQTQEPIKARKKGAFDDVLEEYETQSRDEAYGIGEKISII